MKEGRRRKTEGKGKRNNELFVEKSKVMSVWECNLCVTSRLFV
jgi:hypothetical protein